MLESGCQLLHKFGNISPNNLAQGTARQLRCLPIPDLRRYTRVMSYVFSVHVTTCLLVVLVTYKPASCLGQNAPSSTLGKITSAEVEQAQHRVAELEAEQHKLLNKARNLGPTGQDQNQASISRESAENVKPLASLDPFNKRPRKKFLQSRDEEPVLASYLETWRQKTIKIAMQNYPAKARGKLYGSVTVYIELNAADGSLRSVEVARSSGHDLLDESALRFIRKASPYGPIPREAMDDAEVLCFARSLQFVPGDNHRNP